MFSSVFFCGQAFPDLYVQVDVIEEDAVDTPHPGKQHGDGLRFLPFLDPFSQKLTLVLGEDVTPQNSSTFRFNWNDLIDGLRGWFKVN